MSTYALELKDVSKNYPGFTLDHVSLCVPKGNIVGLIGENGAGKTTTIKIILNEVCKESGEVKVFGKDGATLEKKMQSDIGVVLDECLFPDIFTVNEIESFASKVYPVWEHRIYLSYIKRFELPIDKQVKTFSGGMKVKLSFAVALSHRPKLLILDEATSGLDPIMRDEILDILLDFVQDEEHSVLLSTHITSDLEKIADYITFIHKGKVVFTKPKDDLIYRYGIVKCGTASFDAFDKSDALAYRKQDYEWQILVPDRALAEQKYKKCVVDHATIDEIMLLYVKGEKQ
jgi:ABC-2 type transport system ATP-binding protein